MQPTLRLLILHADREEAATWTAALEGRWTIEVSFHQEPPLDIAGAADVDLYLTSSSSPPLVGYAPWIAVGDSSDAASTIAHLRAGAADVATVAELAGAVQCALDRRRRQAALAEQRLHDRVGLFAGRAGHDLNNTLTVIKGYGDLLYQELSSTPDLQEAASELLAAGERAGALASRFLALSPQRRQSPVAVHLGEFLPSQATAIEARLEPSVQMVVSCRPRTPPVWIDPIHLGQVIFELAANAAEALPDDGRVVLDAAPQGEELPPDLLPGRYVLLRVRDRGHGMDRETLAQAAEPFFTTKAKQMGTGLGLTLAGSLIRHGGGVLVVKSERGRGTEALVYLPVAHESS